MRQMLCQVPMKAWVLRQTRESWDKWATPINLSVLNLKAAQQSNSDVCAVRLLLILLGRMYCRLFILWLFDIVLAGSNSVWMLAQTSRASSAGLGFAKSTRVRKQWSWVELRASLLQSAALRRMSYVQPTVPQRPKKHACHGCCYGNAKSSARSRVV